MKVDRLVLKAMTRAHANALGTARSTFLPVACYLCRSLTALTVSVILESAVLGASRKVLVAFLDFPQLTLAPRVRTITHLPSRFLRRSIKTN